MNEVHRPTFVKKARAGKARREVTWPINTRALVELVEPLDNRGRTGGQCRHPPGEKVS